MKEPKRKYIIIFLCAAFARILFLLFANNTQDDALIYYRIIENVAHGNGWVYNIGEHVNAATSALFVMLNAPLVSIGVPVSVSTKAYGVVFDSLLCSVLFSFLKKPWSYWATALYLVSPSNLFHAANGLETSLYTLLIVLLFVSHNRWSVGVTGIIGGLLVLTRPDGALAVFVVCLFYLPDWKKSVLFGLIAVAVYSPFLVFSQIYFGSIISATVMAKSAYAVSFSNNSLRYLNKFFIGGVPTLCLLVPFIVGSIQIIRKHRYLLPMYSWFWLYSFLFCLKAQFVFGWYFIPLIPAYLTAIAIGIEPFLFFKKKQLVVVVTALLVLSGFALWIKEIPRRRLDLLYWKTVFRPVGEWVRDNTPKDSTVFCEPLGSTGYYSERRMIDYPGLCTPGAWDIVKRNPTHGSGFSLPAYNEIIKAFKPDYLVLRDCEVAEATADALSNYSKVHEVAPDKTVLNKEQFWKFEIYRRNR